MIPGRIEARSRAVAIAAVAFALLSAASAQARPVSLEARPLSPVARPVWIVARPATPQPGEGVRLVVAPPRASQAEYRWTVDGRELDTGPQPTASVTFRSPGAHRVAVLVSVGRWTRSAQLVVTTAQPVFDAQRALAPRPRAPRPRAPRATAGGDPGVTIADFSFTPGTITIHVGDTITWLNNGPSAHTATARNGSFDTGILQRGSSASHTFTQPGTFAFYCSIHPFMHGSVVVLARATSSPSPSSPPAPSAPAAPSAGSVAPSTPAPSAAATPASAGAAQASAQPTLPTTGIDLPLELLTAAALVGGGAVLRRRARRG